MIDHSAGLDLMVQDIERQSTVLRSSLGPLRERSSEIADRLGRNHPSVYLVGCGDSHDAGLAAQYEWEQLENLPVRAMPAMTFSSCAVDTAPPGSLVVALSQSGRVSRVVEAVRAAKMRGLTTITITASPSSPLAQEEADVTWVLDFQKLGSIPGTTSHLLGTVALYELAAAFGGGSRLRAELDILPELCAEATAVVWPVAEDHARAFSRETPVLSLAYGPGLASARFTTRKILETSQLVALCQETEEYAHDEYSLIDQRFQVLLFAQQDRGLNRSIEVGGYLRRIGAHLAVITDGNASSLFEPSASVVYGLPATPSSVAPLLYAVPGQVLSVLVAQHLGGSLYGMAEPIHALDGDPQIYESTITVTASR